MPLLRVSHRVWVYEFYRSCATDKGIVRSSDGPYTHNIDGGVNVELLRRCAKLLATNIPPGPSTYKIFPKKDVIVPFILKTLVSG